MHISEFIEYYCKEKKSHILLTPLSNITLEQYRFFKIAYSKRNY